MRILRRGHVPLVSVKMMHRPLLPAYTVTRSCSTVSRIRRCTLQTQISQKNIGQGARATIHHGKTEGIIANFFWIIRSDLLQTFQ